MALRAHRINRGLVRAWLNNIVLVYLLRFFPESESENSVKAVRVKGGKTSLL